jgi:hypothetical protein
MKRYLLLLLALAPTLAGASKLDQIDQLTLQSDFRKLSEDLGAAASYKALAPAEPLGLTGFDIGVEATATELKNKSSWDAASSGSAVSTLVIPKVHLHKGLPLDFDIGVYYGAGTNSNVDTWGGELRYAFIKGSTAMPALALRATYSTVNGVKNLNLDTAGAELTLSKGIAMVTPYIGVGQIWVESTPTGVSGLNAEKFTLTKYFVGININLAVLNILVDGDRTGEATSYGLKLGWRF